MMILQNTCTVTERKQFSAEQVSRQRGRGFLNGVKWLQLKYGKPEGTFEKAVNSDETFCSSLSETAENKKAVIILRHDAIRFYVGPNVIA